MADAVPLEKLTVAALKKRCKEVKLAMSGEKPALVARLKLHEKGEAVKLDGTNPANLAAGALKKALATRGLPCSLDLEDRDVLVGRLIDALKAEGASSSSGASATEGAGADTSEDDAIALAVDIARQVLALGEGGDSSGVLSLLGKTITTATPFAEQRKAYLQLSRMIHPDKLSRHFDGATRAFQELVRAFDEVTAPPAPVDASGGGKAKANKGPVIARSNDNCHKTRVYCPRCDAEWFTQDAGLMNYDYNLMMQGLKLYCCALCLCEFGCVSAKHRCPHCFGPFAYHPQDYHRQISCGNKKCTKSGATFGFMLYHVPARVENDLRAQIKEEQERRLKAREAAAARQARAARKQPALSEGARRKQAEKLFLKGLIDACPRCGFEPTPGCQLSELQDHLAGCTDAEAHAAHRRDVEAAAEKAAKKASIKDAEVEAQNLAAWQFLGGSTEQMWLLTDKMLEKQAEERGLLTDGSAKDKSREELLVALAKDQRKKSEGKQAAGGAGPARLTDASASASGKRPRAGGSGSEDADDLPRLSAESLPSNLHSMTLSQLKSVCASHGMLAKGKTTSEVIAEIEAALYRGTDTEGTLLLEAKQEAASAKSRGGEDDEPQDAKPSDGEASPPEDSDSEDDVPLSKRKK